MFEKTLAQAEAEYDHDEARAHRVAWSVVKHSYEKVGDHWEKKPHRGPSDERAKSGGPHPHGVSHGGVNVLGHTRAELLERAKSLGIDLGKHATKDDLAEAINMANICETRAALASRKTK